MKTCHCAALMIEPKHMCKRCKLDFIEFTTGFSRKDVIWLAKVATAEERFKKLKDGLQKQKELKNPKGKPKLKLVTLNPKEV